MYIAVYKNKVVRSGKDLILLNTKLRKEFGVTEGIAVEFISSKPLQFLF